eukprot:2332542-Alexandrium_andersonii.AAC.1
MRPRASPRRAGVAREVLLDVLQDRIAGTGCPHDPQELVRSRVAQVAVDLLHEQPLGRGDGLLGLHHVRVEVLRIHGLVLGLGVNGLLDREARGNLCLGHLALESLHELAAELRRIDLRLPRAGAALQGRVIVVAGAPELLHVLQQRRRVREQTGGL